MSTAQEEIDQFWQRYLQTLPEDEHDQNYFEAFQFGNSPQMADELAAVVLDGTKTATSDLLWNREAMGSPMWQVGDRHIVLDGEGRPVCVIETVELQIRPFSDVDEAFAYDYGEGPRTLTWWRATMWAYYIALCRKLGREAHLQMPLIYERFRVLYRE